MFKCFTTFQTRFHFFSSLVIKLSLIQIIKKCPNSYDFFWSWKFFLLSQTLKLRNHKNFVPRNFQSTYFLSLQRPFSDLSSWKQKSWSNKNRCKHARSLICRKNFRRRLLNELAKRQLQLVSLLSKRAYLHVKIIFWFINWPRLSWNDI